MMSRVTYHDRPDHILKIETISPTQRIKTILPKTNESGRKLAESFAPPRRIETKRTGASAARPNRTDCANLVGYTGDSVGHACGGCSGGQFTSVWECRLFGDCAPLAWAPLKPDGAHVRRCCDCGAYAPPT